MMIYSAKPSLDHIEYTPVSHSYAKGTSQLCTGELWCSRNATAKYGHNNARTPYTAQQRPCEESVVRLLSFNKGSAIEIHHCQGHQRHRVA